MAPPVLSCAFSSTTARRCSICRLARGFWGGSDVRSNKQGLPDAKLGWFFFPEIRGGKGMANDIFGSVYGWLISHDAPKETLEFMKVLLGKDIQTKLAAEGLS